MPPTGPARGRARAEKKLIEARKEMFGRPSDEGGDDEALRRRYVEYQRRIEVAVKNGELSREEAEKKLIELRKKMFADPQGEQQAEQGRRERTREER